MRDGRPQGAAALALDGHAHGKNDDMSERKTIRFDGVLLSGHKGPAVEVPFDPAEELGLSEVSIEPGRRGYPVEVLLGRTRFRSAIVSRNRRLFLLVDETLAKRAGAVIGQPVTLSIWADLAK
jgi:hypothetical protein